MQIEGLVLPSQEWGAQHEGVGDPASFVVPPYAASFTLVVTDPHCVKHAPEASVCR